jgi:hypothetical protein
MQYSVSFPVLEMAFLQLKDSGLLYSGKLHYSEYHKNVLKDHLKKNWKWKGRHAIQAIRLWMKRKWIDLDGDCIVFLFTEVPKKKMFRVIRDIF